MLKSPSPLLPSVFLRSVLHPNLEIVIGELICRAPLVRPFGYIGFVVGIVGMLVPVLWLTLHGAYQKSNATLKWNLNLFSLLLTAVGCICNFPHFPSPGTLLTS